MEKSVNYGKLFAIKSRLEKEIKKACPAIKHTSGIYFYTRVDEKGKYAYIGKARDLIDRSVSHLQGYIQKIDISLKKRGFYSPENDNGWKLNVLFFPIEMLDERENYYIDAYRNAGYELYNIESGGTTGKTLINERKPAKGYYDGLKQARKKLKEELRYIIDRYLIISLKKDGKLAQRALEKFNNLIYKDENDENEEKDE